MGMTDMTTHDEAKTVDAPIGAPSWSGAAIARAPAREDGLSKLALSAGARLTGVALALATLWAGVWWALH